MRLVDLTRGTWPSLAELFSANKTVGRCWCVKFMRGATSVEGHPVDTEGQKKVSGDLFHGTRRAPVRRELT